MNNRRVFVLMAGLTALLAALGQAFGGQGGLIMALLFAGLIRPSPTPLRPVAIPPMRSYASRKGCSKR